MKIAILTLSDRSDNFVKYSNKTKELYAEKHENVDYVFIDHVLLNDKHPVWSKIPAVLSILDSYDYVVWVDDDAIITNFNFNLEPYFNDHDIYYTNDNYGLNAGVFAVKNSQVAKDFLNDVLNNYEKFKDYVLKEQEAIKFLLSEKYSQYATELPATLWNSYLKLFYQPHNLWSKDSFILHLAGVPPQMRDRIFHEKLKELGFNDD